VTDPCGASWPRVVKADDHVGDMEILLSALPPDLPRRGVVHVGAHRGEEVPVFRRFGFRHALLIEANPDHVVRLKENFADDDDIQIEGTAIGDRTGVVELLLHTSRSGSTEPASLLPLKELQEIVPTIRTASAIQVPITTLDALARQGSLATERYNLLVVDVQGAERMAFRGARELAPTLDAIVTEVNLVPLYEGASLEGDLLDDLRTLGFCPRHGVYHELYRGESRFVAWGECLLLRGPVHQPAE
jgi:FkbM family methyltransferase